MTKCDLYRKQIGMSVFDDFEPFVKPLPDGCGSVAGLQECPHESGHGRPEARSTDGLAAAVLLAFSFLLAGCNERVKADPKLEAPPPAKVEHELDASLIKVDH